MSIPAISISGLTKSFGRTKALDRLDLTVATGEVHGFLGPNGSGKTTTIRVLLGLLRADGGSASLLGGDPWRDAAALHRRTGDTSYAGWQGTFEEYIAEHLIDSELGSWHHELDEQNRPAATTWRGKPDVYHAYQALLLARMPLAPVLSVQMAQLARGQL